MPPLASISNSKYRGRQIYYNPVTVELGFQMVPQTKLTVSKTLTMMMMIQASRLCTSTGRGCNNDAMSHFLGANAPPPPARSVSTHVHIE